MITQENVSLIHDKEGNTLTVWFGGERAESNSEQIGDLIIIKNASGKVIGIEKLNFE